MPSSSIPGYTGRVYRYYRNGHFEYSQGSHILERSAFNEPPERQPTDSVAPTIIENTDEIPSVTIRERYFEAFPNCYCIEYFLREEYNRFYRGIFPSPEPNRVSLYTRIATVSGRSSVHSAPSAIRYTWEQKEVHHHICKTCKKGFCCEGGRECRRNRTGVCSTCFHSEMYPASGGTNDGTIQVNTVQFDSWLNTYLSASLNGTLNR